MADPELGGVATDVTPDKPKPAPTPTPKATQRADSTRKTNLQTGGTQNSANPVDDAQLIGLINNPVDYWTFPAPSLTVGNDQFHVYLIRHDGSVVLLDEAVEQLDWADEDSSGGVLTGNLQLRDVETRPHDFLVKPGDMIALWVRDNDGRFKEWWRMRCITPSMDYLSGARTFDMKNDLHRLIDSTNDFKYVKSKPDHAQGWTGRQVFQDICDQYGIPLLCPTLKTVLTDFTKNDWSPASVLVYVLTKEFRETGIRYLWAYDHGTMVVRPRQRSDLMLKLGSLLTQAGFSETIATDFATAIEMRSVPDTAATDAGGAIVGGAVSGSGYFPQVFRQMGITPTDASMKFMNAWAHREGVPQSIDTYNLLGTTLPRGGSHGTNAPGVQAYPTADDGISAHSAMLNQGNFAPIKTALASGDPESYSGDASVRAAFSTWSGGGYDWPSTGMPTSPVTANGPGGPISSSVQGSATAAPTTPATTATTTSVPKYKGPPIFTEEGPKYYDDAYAHNSPFATGGPYLTVLTGPQEAAFRAWVTANNVPVDPDENPTDYDMRGFYKASVIDNSIPDWGGTPGVDHFPDTFKTPYDTSFSNQSQYATSDCPFKWVTDDLLVDTRTNQIVFGPAGAGVGKTAKASHSKQSVKGLKVEVRVDSAIDRYGLVTQMGYAFASSVADLEEIGRVHMALMLRADKTVTVTHPAVVGLRKFDAVKVFVGVDPKIFSYVLFVKAISFSLAAGQFDMTVTLQVDDPLVVLPDDKVYDTLAAAQGSRSRPVSKKTTTTKKSPVTKASTQRSDSPDPPAPPNPELGGVSTDVTP